MHNKLSIYDVACIGVWAAMTFAVKMILAPVANVELVSFLICTFTVIMGLKRGVLAAITFTTITVFESTYYGAGDWIILYYINWPLLAVLSGTFLKGRNNEIRAAVLLGLFGLLFDVPSTALKVLFFGPVYAVSYFISGIPFDIIHGAANFVSALFLYKPVCTALYKLRNGIIKRST